MAFVTIVLAGLVLARRVLALACLVVAALALFGVISAPSLALWLLLVLAVSAVL